MKSHKRAPSICWFYAINASLMVAWFAGCTLFQPQPPPAPRPESLPPPVAPLTLPTLHPTPIRPRPAHVRKPPPTPAPSPAPSAPPAPAPLVTLENGEDPKAHAQRLLDHASASLTHFSRAELPGNTASTYEEASELIDAARHALANQDYPAASSLAEKASALITQLPSRK